jgi:hypothetical protein
VAAKDEDDDNRDLSRRRVLLGSTGFAAASAMGLARPMPMAQAQP